MCTVRAGCGSTTVDINKMEAGKFFFFLYKKLGSILVAEKAYLLVGNDSSGNIVVGIFLVS